MLRIKLAAALLLVFGSTAHAEMLTGVAEFVVLTDAPVAGVSEGDIGRLEFGFDPDAGTVDAFNYIVNADYLLYDFGTTNSRFEGDIFLVISENLSFGTDGIFLEFELPGDLATTGFGVFGDNESFITGPLAPREVVFDVGASRELTVQQGSPRFIFQATLTSLSVPEPSCLSYIFIASILVTSLRRELPRR